jgi:hypothetical protein
MNRSSFTLYTSSVLAGVFVLVGGLDAARGQSSKAPGAAPQVVTISPEGRWSRFEQGQKRRVHVWHDDQGWHIRCTCNRKEPTEFVGKVTVDKPPLKLTSGDAEKARKARKADFIQKVRNGLAFRFKTSGKLDGIDFNVPREATILQFEFRVDRDNKAEYIFIGRTGQHPRAATFALPANP